MTDFCGLEMQKLYVTAFTFYIYLVTFQYLLFDPIQSCEKPSSPLKNWAIFQRFTPEIIDKRNYLAAFVVRPEPQSRLNNKFIRAI